MMSGGGGGSDGLRYFLYDSAEDYEDTNPRILKDDFGIAPEPGYEVQDQEDGYRLADTLRDELEMSQEIHDTGNRMKELYEASWISLHPDEADEVSDEEFIEIAEDYLAEMGWSDHRTMIVAHDHTDHRDRHLIVDRVDHENGETLDVDHAMERRIEAGRTLERKHDLIEVQPVDRPAIGASTEHLLQRMEERGFKDELYTFIENKVEQGIIQSKGDFRAILDEARLETEDHGNYVTVIHPDTGGRERVGEDDIEEVDWSCPEITWNDEEIDEYRESVRPDEPVLIDDPAEFLKDGIGEEFEKDPSHKLKSQLRDRFDSETDKSVDELKDDLKVSLDKRETFEDRIRDRMEEFREADQQTHESEPTPEQSHGVDLGGMTP